MYDFEYVRSHSLADAAAALNAHDDARPLAGGMTLIPVLKQRLAQASHLVDLADLTELRGIAVNNTEVRIGAMTPHADVAASKEIRTAIPALAELAGLIGDPQVRHRGTIGGSIANNDPAADYPAAVLALGAAIETNQRAIAADDFFTGMFETALGRGEIIKSVKFPVPDAAVYEKFRNPASRYALAGVFVSRSEDAVRVAVTGAGPGVFRQSEMEKALTANWSATSIASIAQSEDGLTSDIHGSAAYRAHLVGVLARRAVNRLVKK